MRRVLRVLASSGLCVLLCPAPSAFSQPPPLLPTGALTYVALSPCIVLSTFANPPLLGANQTRLITVGGRCGVPEAAKAVMLTATIAQPAAAGYLLGFAPGDSGTLLFMSWDRAGTLASSSFAAALPLSGELAIYSTTATQLILYVEGYFESGVSSINGLADDVVLAAGENISITTSPGNTLTVSATEGREGPQGPPGPQGPAGPQGPPGIALAYAHVLADGTLDATRSSANISVQKAGGGQYCFDVTGGTVHVAVASLDAQVNVGGSVQAAVIPASVCPVGWRDIYVVTREHAQDGGLPGDDRAFYIIVN